MTYYVTCMPHVMTSMGDCNEHALYHVLLPLLIAIVENCFICLSFITLMLET